MTGQYCPHCGQPLLPTSEQFAICPRGCGGLVPRVGASPQQVEREAKEWQRRLDKAFPKGKDGAA